MDGDFSFSSGKKSKYFYDFDRLHPQDVRRYAKQLVANFGLKDQHFSFVATIAIGGINLAFSIALELNLPLIVIDKRDTIRGDLTVLSDNWLFVDDVVSNFTALERTTNILKCSAASMAICFMFRGENEHPDIPVHYLEKGEVEK